MCRSQSFGKNYKSARQGKILQKNVKNTFWAFSVGEGGQIILKISFSRKSLQKNPSLHRIFILPELLQMQSLITSFYL